MSAREGRERKPSAKARALASGYFGDSPAPSISSATSKKVKPSKPAPSKTKKHWSQYDDDSEDEPAESAAPEPEATTNDYEIPRTYCICLGDDDSTPMIQCEGCENWYHFRCIDLHEDEAKRIKAYYCENCALAGLGQTRYFGQGGTPSPPPEDKQDLAYDPVDPQQPSDSDEENLPLQPFVAKKRASGGGSKRPKKRAKAEGTSDEDEDEDGTYRGDGDPVVDYEYSEKVHKRKPSTPRSVSDKRGKLEALANKRRGSEAVRLTTDPAATRTRQGVKTQLVKTLADIYLKGEPPTGRLNVDHIEQKLFDLTAEMDHTGGMAPKNKYTAKFRSLFQNMRSNAYLRARLSSGIGEDYVSAHALVNMSPEDLLTPEQRALAQQVQEKSMRDSIKAAIEAPKAKVTHKGEEVIDELATTDDRVQVRPRQTSFAAGSPTTPHSPSIAQSPPAFLQSSPREREPSFSAQPENAFSPRDETLMGPPPLPRVDSGPMLVSREAASDSAIEAAMESPSDDFRSFSAPPPPAGSPTTRASFDIDSIWGSFKSPTLDQSPPAEDTEKDQDDMDVGDSPTEIENDNEAEADLDDFLAEGSGKAKERSSAAEAKPTEPSAPSNGQLRPEQLAPIWDGTIESVDEYSFPTFAVQVAGRLLGTNRDYWHRIVPPSPLRVEGSLKINVASDYLVQNTFSSSRELIVLALLPDLSGPDAGHPKKASPEQAQSDHAGLVRSLSEKNRAAVILPQDRQKKAVKDLYLVPLLKTDPVPDFVELLEAHALGEGKERDRDYLLLVAVLQKGMLPQPIFDIPTPASLPAPPAGMPMPPGGFSSPFPGAPASALAGLDPAAVQALLAQPQLLQNLVSQMPPQQPASLPPLPPQQQVNNLLSNLDPSVLGALLKQPTSTSAPLQQAQSLSSRPMGMAVNPERMRMMGTGRGQQGGQYGGVHDRRPSHEYNRGRGGYR